MASLRIYIIMVTYRRLSQHCWHLGKGLVDLFNVETIVFYGANTHYRYLTSHGNSPVLYREFSFQHSTDYCTA